MENWFLNMGMSWTMSKALPYILMIVLGVVFVRIALGRMKGMGSKLVKIAVSILVLTLPFATYFAFNPIYQGDFSNGGEVFSESTELNPEKLTVIAMPGCPFCKQSIGLMSKMQERNPKMSIDFLVTSDNKEALKMYQETAAQVPIKINIALAKDPGQLSQLAKGSFPSFALKSNESWKVWSNSSFGVMALDEVEGNF